ncbi:hypothetical protein CLAFUW4_10139 [Fulvia fulva]|uniref:RING-type domain-containing protein n=1 Tax=Passalora fulva TaxID=5499 RepID=A0A9Q8LG27_PASFU|nr:uncharacterized protein CLAFUR5_04752 [Fulvia fulva]UJO16835.1 hypothetical protein CLAFUR5_04752 [Fulvia fulva]WPV19600.1 hypothetical protein CLAFUW4_10139 [Fulvia fulva]
MYTQTYKSPPPRRQVRHPSTHKDLPHTTANYLNTLNTLYTLYTMSNANSQGLTGTMACGLGPHVLVSPAVTPCGHHFCTACLQRYIETADICPICNAILVHRETVAFQQAPHAPATSLQNDRARVANLQQHLLPEATWGSLGVVRSTAPPTQQSSAAEDTTALDTLAEVASAAPPVDTARSASQGSPKPEERSPGNGQRKKKEN